MSKRQKKVHKALNSIEHLLLVLAFAVTGYVSMGIWKWIDE